MFLSDLSDGENNWKEKNLGTSLKVSLMSMISGNEKLPVLFSNSLPPNQDKQIPMYECNDLISPELYVLLAEVPILRPCSS